MIGKSVENQNTQIFTTPDTFMAGALYGDFQIIFHGAPELQGSDFKQSSDTFIYFIVKS